MYSDGVYGFLEESIDGDWMDNIFRPEVGILASLS
jgi:hypothetical protein